MPKIPYEVNLRVSGNLNANIWSQSTMEKARAFVRSLATDCADALASEVPKARTAEISLSVDGQPITLED